MHYMDPSLLIKDGGPKFQDYLVMNGKLLAASDAIMKEAIVELIQARPDLLQQYARLRGFQITVITCGLI